VTGNGGAERVVILGSAGAGKTTLAAGIARRTGLPVVHLDPVFWRPGWAAAPQDEARRELATLAGEPRWVLDGNFLPAQGADDPRFTRADTVVFLDISRARCLWRVLRRLVADRGRSRPDLPEGCWEGFDLPLLRWIWRYPAADRPRVLRLLGTLPGHVGVHRLRSGADVRRFLRHLDGGSDGDT
jgi:adenylate kinase family enzyme